MGATGGYLYPLAIKRILGMLTEAGRSSSRRVVSPRMVRRAHCRRYLKPSFGWGFAVTAEGFLLRR